MTTQLFVILILAFFVTLGLAKLAIRWGTSKIEAEQKELKIEEFTLRKQMLHDKHRLAYIVARKAMLDAAAPAPATTIRTVVSMPPKRAFHYDAQNPPGAL